MTRYLLPLAVFVALVVAMAAGLSRDPHELPSALVDRPAPAFRLPLLGTNAVLRPEMPASSLPPAPSPEPAASLGSTELQGKVWLLNVWASWCAACRTEHPVLERFAAGSAIPMYGLNYKDDPDAARLWLQRMGNPYAASLIDREGKVGIDYGVYGVPETFVIDRAGIVRYRHVGAVTQEVLDRKIVPLLKRLEREGGNA